MQKEQITIRVRPEYGAKLRKFSKGRGLAMGQYIEALLDEDEKQQQPTKKELE